MSREAALALVLVLMASVARAQAPSVSFAQLERRLKIGETVLVTNDAGETVEGTVARVSDTYLVLRRDSVDFAFPESDVRRVARPNHAILTGAVLGLTTGAVSGAAWASSQGCGMVCLSRGPGIALFGGLFGAIGMGIGAGAGASLPRADVIFDRTGLSRAHSTLRPWLSQAGTGLRVEVYW